MTSSTKKRYRKQSKRRCRRCKISFSVIDNSNSKICLVCKTKCSRCDVSLTDKNMVKPGKGHHQHICKTCTSEVTDLKRQKLYSRDYSLTRCYGITYNEYCSILESQDGTCWICQRNPTNKALHVDHLHVRGDAKTSAQEKRKRVRGLLCWRCNTSIGKFNDDPVFLRRAAEFLERKPAQQILKHNEPC